MCQSYALKHKIVVIDRKTFRSKFYTLKINKKYKITVDLNNLHN